MPNKKMKKELLKCYKYVSEYPDYKNVIVNAALSEYFGINEENLTLTNGSLEGINLLVNCLRRKKATLFQPTFWGYENALNRYNYNINNETLDKNINYNLIKINKAAKKSDIIIICNPNNPTLSFISKEDILNIIKTNPKCNFIIDETMLIFDKEYEKKTMVKEVVNFKNLSVVISFSKFLGIAGLRTGCIFSNKTIIKRIKGVKIPYSLGIISQKMLTIALSDKEYLNKTRSLIETNRKWLCKKLKELKCKVIDCNTNFILVELPTNIDSTKTTKLLEKDNLIVRDIKEFYPLLKGNWLRISIQKPKYNKLLIKKIKKIIQ